MNVAISIAIILVLLINLWLVDRYNIHIFQLNGYKNKEHFAWLIKNFSKQVILLPEIIIAAMALMFGRIVIAVCFVVLSVIISLYYFHLKNTNIKKKLVITNRVKRLIAALSLINIIICVVLFWLFKAATVLSIIILLQPILVIVANIVNSPIERAINQHYINDAKRILKSMPDLVVIGVTGSYGKTSVKFYLQTLLQAKYNVLVTPESYNTPMGVVRTIRENLRPTHQIFVCEMGARNIGDIKEICDIVNPTHAVITSIGPAHLESFLSMENIKKTKFELADAVNNKGMIFVNADNEYIRQKIHEYQNVIMYSCNSQDAAYYASDIKLSAIGTEFNVNSSDNQVLRFNLKLVGEHNVINVIGAIAVANKLGIQLSELITPVRRIKSVSHRMELINRGNVTIIDDAYNSNPIGSKAAVETLAMFDGLKILVTPGMVELGDKEEEYNYKFGTYAAKCCDYILLVGQKRAEAIKKGVLDSGFDENKCKVYDTLQAALSFAYSIDDTDQKYILLENDLPDNY